MASKPKLKSYLVGAYVHVWCDYSIKAESLAQAAALAQELELSDFVQLTDGACNDSRLEIIQVYDEDSAL